jgi:hypothetical protein
MKRYYILFLLLAFFLFPQSSFSELTYCWLDSYSMKDSIAQRIPVPQGCSRIIVKDDSFAMWLRYLPLKSGRPPVLLYNGMLKSNQDVHHAVINMDVGNKNLQQCADFIMRLRAEYLYGKGSYNGIHFNITDNSKAVFTDWVKGFRPVIKGKRITWKKTAAPDASYTSFRKYITFVFAYAGTYSLSRELKPVIDFDTIGIGDIFIQGGFPGHAVIVVDMAVHKDTGQKYFLLAQSYMPAQEAHVLRNPEHTDMNPWYECREGNDIITPEWTFKTGDLKRFQ